MTVSLIFVIKLIITVWAIFISIAILIFKYKEKQRRPVKVGGYVHPDFKHLKDVFIDNLRRSWERDGAAMCVYYKGDCVVDLWGGLSDKDSQREWTQDTMQIIFSTTKALGAICVALLVEKGNVHYSDKVSSFWPEFGKKGKENITVEMILTHTAGLALIDHQITWENARSPEQMANILENQSPHSVPGENIGYHAFSYGWLIDQIIRRNDPKGRGIGDFWREEIASKHNLDIHIGLPIEMSWRVARITRPSLWNRLDEFVTDPENVDYLFILKQYLFRGVSKRVATNPPWMQTIFNVTMNNPEMYTLEQPAVLGISTARDMARLANLLMSGKVLKKETFERMNEVLVQKRDIISGAMTTRGRGTTIVQYNRNGIHSNLVGHAGLGGQNFRWDVENQLAIMYLSNGLKGGLGDRARSYVRVMDALFDCLPTRTYEATSTAREQDSEKSIIRTRTMESINRKKPISDRNTA